VRGIGAHCFFKCAQLQAVWLEPGSTEEVGNSAFAQCTALGFPGLTMETRISAIPRKLCYSCLALRSVLIPRAVTGIEEMAFAECISLQEVDFGQPSNLSVIGNSAFAHCDFLSEVNFRGASKLSIIGANAFEFCPSLQRFHIVGSVSNIGQNFIGVSGVSDITVDRNNGHFQRVDYFLLGEEGRSVFLYFSRGAEVVVPSYVVILRDRSFFFRFSLESVSFDDGSRLQSIEASAFEACHLLRSIRLPASLEMIGAYAFSDCPSLVAVTFEAPSKLREIGARAFMNCDLLASISFPRSLMAIRADAFRSCENLQSVTFEMGSPPQEIGAFAFDGCPCLDLAFLRAEHREREILQTEKEALISRCF
jgi:hypothetical protein